MVNGRCCHFHQRSCCRRKSEGPRDVRRHAPDVANGLNLQYDRSLTFQHAARPPVTTTTETGRKLFTNYEALRVLGRGSMGTVYLARDLRDGSIVALKTI